MRKFQKRNKASLAKANKAVGQPTIKLLQRLKGKSIKIMCSYNNKLRIHTNTNTTEVKNNDNIHGVGKN